MIFIVRNIEYSYDYQFRVLFIVVVERPAAACDLTSIGRLFGCVGSMAAVIAQIPTIGTANVTSVRGVCG